MVLVEHQSLVGYRKTYEFLLCTYIVYSRYRKTLYFLERFNSYLSPLLRITKPFFFSLEARCGRLLPRFSKSRLLFLDLRLKSRRPPSRSSRLRSPRYPPRRLLSRPRLPRPPLPPLPPKPPPDGLNGNGFSRAISTSGIVSGS